MISLLTFKRNRLACCLLLCALLAIIYPASSVLAQKFADHAYTPRSHVPPLQKGGTGGFLTPDSPGSNQSKSPFLPLFQRGKQTRSQSELLSQLQSPDTSKAQSLCVEIRNDNGTERSVPVRLGSTLRLSFRHSIYGSQVEELFAVRRNGFELTQLRYGEARLVDFYGYENAKNENGVWIVAPVPALFPSLSLHLSADASMSLYFDRHSDSKGLVIQPGGSLRLTIATCKNRAND